MAESSSLFRWVLLWRENIKMLANLSKGRHPNVTTYGERMTVGFMLQTGVNATSVKQWSFAGVQVEAGGGITLMPHIHKIQWAWVTEPHLPIDASIAFRQLSWYVGHETTGVSFLDPPLTLRGILDNTTSITGVGNAGTYVVGGKAEGTSHYQPAIPLPTGILTTRIASQGGGGTGVAQRVIFIFHYSFEHISPHEFVGLFVNQHVKI